MRVYLIAPADGGCGTVGDAHIEAVRRRQVLEGQVSNSRDNLKKNLMKQLTDIIILPSAGIW